MVEEKDYRVTLTFRLSTVVSFAPIEREGPLTKEDAIGDAIESLPILFSPVDKQYHEWAWFAEQEGFTVAYTSEATEVAQ